MSKTNKRVLIGLGVVLSLIGVITLSYAFLSTGDKQSLANTFTSGCLNITVNDETNAISLNGAYPVTDVEGLSLEGYTFTVKNTCSTSADFIVNLENINRQENTLSSDYLKVAISGDTFDNIVSILSSNQTSTPSISNAYEAYTLYTGSIEGNATRTFKIREWLDYEATKEQAANKIITNKINVIAKSNLEVENRPEIKFELNDKTLIGTITGNATSAKYCTTGDNACTPSLSASISSNTVSINLSGEKRIETVATALGNIEVNTGGTSIACSVLNDGTRYCSNPYETKVNPDFSQRALTDEGVYKATDESGKDSYYFRGAVENNYVKFANKYWRIIRINGDGTIRMIYDGETARANGSTFTADTSRFNASTNNNMYVGFKYTSGQVHGTGSKSAMLETLETWYTNNLSSYASKIDTNAGFCGDRTPSNGSGGTGTTTTYYGGYIRLVNSKSPILTCPTEDFYTVSGSSKGNKSLTYPIGLITADEVSMAGGVWATANQSYYLYTGQAYWTLSPYYFSGTYASVFCVGSAGTLNAYNVNYPYGVRPVINLKANTTMTGKGTASDPYVVL